VSSDLYQLEVLARDDERSTVTLRITCCNYSGLPGSRPFFFRELYNSADELREDAPILAEVTWEQYCDDEFLGREARRFVVDVSSDDSSFHQERDDDEDDDTAHGDTMTYEVEVSDLRWIQHLRVGDTWGTTGYDLNETHVDPADEDPATSTDPDGRRGLRRVDPDWIDTQERYGWAPRSAMPPSFLITTCTIDGYRPERELPADEVTPQGLRDLVGTVVRLDHRSLSGDVMSRVVTLLAVDDTELTYLERNYSVLIDRVRWERVIGVATVGLRAGAQPAVTRG
jgi:hypothetical protein